MLKIYEIETARDTLLRRERVNTANYPAALLAGVEEIFGEGVRPYGAVQRILETVQEGGDAALIHWTKILDKTELDDFLVPPGSFKPAYEALPGTLVQALNVAAERIRDFHERQPLPNWTTTEMGGLLGQRATPVERAGVYIPGGSAPLPSSLLMSVIPAQVAGVERIVITTPPNPHDTILAAAHICGVDEVYQIGGAQAVAAMAFGTESVPKVDTIVGAGNLFVTLAKQQVYGIVGLDGLAGPTETMVIADETANPAWVAADLLAQAEHDPLASAILLTTSQALAESVQTEVAQQMETLSRREIIAQSLDARGGVVITPDLDTAADLANAYAAEHLCLAVEDPQTLSEAINNTGGFFLGDHSFEVLGDYVAGPSHIMPTGGSARFSSPLNVMDFVKINSIIALDPETAQTLSAQAAEIAHAEGLTAHAASAECRMVKRDSEGL
ncbi:MAG: Histidinol dehydrogenase [Chloroflexi bacterium]|nr:Histidinol dehydrogenase [Chloroflexota bacterium]